MGDKSAFEFEGNSSYLFGTDDLSGWGKRYFFTFYTELGDEKLRRTLESIIFISIFISSVASNVSIAAAVLRYREMRTVTNCFLLNLTVADLLFVSGIPLLTYSRLSVEWKFGNGLCKLLPYSQFVCGFVLLWTLTWISMDRYRCIVVPPFRSELTPTKATLLTITTWLVALVIFLPVAFWFREQRVEYDNLKICTLVFPQKDTVNMSLLFTVATVALSCIAPLSLFVYHYQRIFCKLTETRERWKQNSVTYKVRSAENGFSEHEEMRFKSHLRVIHILLVNVLVVLIMWLPITLIMLLIYIDGSRSNEDTKFFLRSHHFIWVLQIALLNTIVNPLLYGLLSENFRKCFIRIWFRSQQKKALHKDVYKERTSNSYTKKQLATNSTSVGEN